MNKNLLKKIASVATELDVKGFTKEAMTMDKVLIRVAQMSDEDKEAPIEVDDELLKAFEKRPGDDVDYDAEIAKTDQMIYDASIAKTDQMIKDIIGDRYEEDSFLNTIENTMQKVLKVKDNLNNLKKNINPYHYQIHRLNDFDIAVQSLEFKLKDFVEMCEENDFSYERQEIPWGE